MSFNNDVDDNKSLDGINYCSDFICTYHLHDLEDQDVMYKCQFLQAFMIEDLCDDSVDKTIKKLMNELMNEKSNPNYIENKEQMERLLKNVESNLFPSIYWNNTKINTEMDKQIFLFKFLFVFDYFFKTHELICNYFNSKNDKKIVSKKIIDDLINICLVGTKK